MLFAQVMLNDLQLHLVCVCISLQVAQVSERLPGAVVESCWFCVNVLRDFISNCSSGFHLCLTYFSLSALILCVETRQEVFRRTQVKFEL